MIAGKSVHDLGGEMILLYSNMLFLDNTCYQIFPTHFQRLCKAYNYVDCFFLSVSTGFLGAFFQEFRATRP